MKTRVISILLVIVLLISMCGCKSGNPAEEPSEDQQNAAGIDLQSSLGAAEPSESSHISESSVKPPVTEENTPEPPETAEDSAQASATDESATDPAPTDETAAPLASEPPADDETPVSAELSTEPSEPDDPTAQLSQKQENSIAMLNYLAMISQEIESAKDTHNSRLLLEEVYASLLNNTSPDKLDEKSQRYISELLDIIKDYRMISLKRERLQLLYDQEKAILIREGMQSMLHGVSNSLTDLNNLDWKQLSVNVAFTAMESYNQYKIESAELDNEFMISGWELDDKEAETIHNNRKTAFNYMIDIVREYDLPGTLALSEEAIQNFVTQTKNENVFQRLQFLESKEAVYGKFGEYWLARADCYYETDDYAKCLECINRYKDLNTGIFRQDFSYAKRLPEAIVSAQHVCSKDTYVEVIANYTDALTRNAADSDWALLYFAAQSYIDLYEKTNDKGYLRAAYDIVVNNINQLVGTQIKNNTVYLNDLEELKLDPLNIREDATKKEAKEQKKNYKEEEKRLDALNKSLKKKRKTELPAVYEPLVLNCDLLFALAEELDISQEEKARIEGILQSNTGGVFLTKPISEYYSFGPHADQQYIAVLNTKEFILSADLLCEGATVTASVETDHGVDVFDDWTVSKVERGASRISSFSAYFESDEIKKHDWSDGEIVTFTVSYRDICDPLEFKFQVKYKENWWILQDDVEFIQK